VITWVIGAGGLLGSSIVRKSDNVFPAEKVPWQDPSAAIATLQSQAEQFQRTAAAQEWSIIWAAGRATTASTATETAIELSIFAALVNAIRTFLPAGEGGVFIASSAGGIYSGSQDPPFDRHSAPQPLGAYGELKLAQEQLAIEVLHDFCPVVIGRMSNLYGPGQDLTKLQGLISRLARASIDKVPLTMFVSLDTLRDYIYVDDAASVISYWMYEVPKETGSPIVAVIASGQSVSLGYVIALMRDITRTRIPIAYGAHASAAVQSRDLRLIPTNVEDTSRLVSTPFVVGAKQVYLDILARYQTDSTTR